jgi:hypothetical protein
MDADDVGSESAAMAWPSGWQWARRPESVETRALRDGHPGPWLGWNTWNVAYGIRSFLRCQRDSETNRRDWVAAPGRRLRRILRPRGVVAEINCLSGHPRTGGIRRNVRSS